MINKKGLNLNDEVPEILLGILCLFLIGLTIWMLITTFSSNENENAKKTIDSLEGKINFLKEGQTANVQIQGFKGSEESNLLFNGWFLVGWNKSESGKPDKCLFNSCICICKGSIAYGKENLAKICQDNGICRKFDFSDIRVSRYTYVYETAPGAGNTGGNAGGGSSLILSNSKKTCTAIGLRANLIEIVVEKKKDSVSIINNLDIPSKNEACF